jgi:hypothetical protein
MWPDRNCNADKLTIRPAVADDPSAIARLVRSEHLNPRRIAPAQTPPGVRFNYSCAPIVGSLLSLLRGRRPNKRARDTGADPPDIPIEPRLG